MKVEDYNLDMTECWLRYHFPSVEERLAYHKTIFRLVEQMVDKYWPYHSFLNFITFRAIDYMVKMDWKPSSSVMIRIAISHAFYGGHIDFGLMYAGVRRKKKKK